MATPLGIAFSTDEQVVAQDDITYIGKMVESLIVEFDQAKYEEFLSSGSKSPERGSTAGSPRAPVLQFTLRSLQIRLTRRVPWLTISHVTPASTSPTRLTRLALLIFNPFMHVLFLSSRSPGVPSNPYDVTGLLNVDRGDTRVNYRCKKLQQLSVQQIQNARLKPTSLPSYVRRAKSA